ncbi:hypothetical protein OPT61_g7634 [Boeremia exigua]|uniref:Uncharacterized protein n=1 Tax=Boeremia exigua TaxID=749465 RepID=A0ACC2I2L6_9PLEO|nr:hypothetical protein OPT61_g7634 [Boeremia exigua]
MANTFIYKKLDLDRRSFRLIRLCKGDEGPVECELLHAYVGDDDDGMEYEALSYTWGDLAKPYSIRMNEQVMGITENLFHVLRHLRHGQEDRFLWIDALCINQDDHEERGHQVRQMASIYERARQVIFWLGTATVETDRAFDYMQHFERAAYNYSCNSWRPSDERWQFVLSTVELRRSRESGTTDVPLADFEAILDREWFKRVWIIQEVAKARSAMVVCGTKSVSARIFALIPSLLDVKQTPRSRSILEIMPGPSRKFSWWLEEHDLETLLRKFSGSKSSDPRDMIYALLGISSDAKGLKPDYTKSLQQVVSSTIVILLNLDSVGISSSCLPHWPLQTYLSKFPKFGLLRQDIIFSAFNREQTAALRVLFNDNIAPAIEFVAHRWKTGQTIEEVSQSLEFPGDTGWEILLDTNKAEIDYLNRLSKEGWIPAPMLWAAQRDRKDIAELFLASGKVDFSAWKQWTGEKLLSTAAEIGHTKIFQMLLEQQDEVDDSIKHSGPTPLHLAVSGNHTPIARMLLETRRADINARDEFGRTPLMTGAKNTNTSMIDLLLGYNHIMVNAKDKDGTTPLGAAAKRGDTNMVEALLKLARVDINNRDNLGRTPFAIALENGHELVVSAFLNSHRVDITSPDGRGYTPLASAVESGQEAIVSALLATHVYVNLPEVDWTSPFHVEASKHPLILAIHGGHTAILEILLESGCIEMKRTDLPMLMSQALVQTHDPGIYRLLEGFARTIMESQTTGTAEDTGIDPGSESR